MSRVLTPDWHWVAADVRAGRVVQARAPGVPRALGVWPWAQRSRPVPEQALPAPTRPAARGRCVGGDLWRWRVPLCCPPRAARRRCALLRRSARGRDASWAYWKGLARDACQRARGFCPAGAASATFWRFCPHQGWVTAAPLPRASGVILAPLIALRVPTGVDGSTSGAGGAPRARRGRCAATRLF